MTFTFDSDNFASLPKFAGTHIGIGLLVDTVQLTTNYPPTNAPAAVGNGIIIGDVDLTTNGCADGTNTTAVWNFEIESYWNGGNELFQNTCSPSGFTDGPYYKFQIQANLTGNVFYDVNVGTTWSASANTLPYRPPGKPGTLSGGGLFFAFVGVANASPEITLNFTNVATLWY